MSSTKYVSFSPRVHLKTAHWRRYSSLSRCSAFVPFSCFFRCIFSAKAVLWFFLFIFSLQVSSRITCFFYVFEFYVLHYLRTPLFCVITQRVVVISYWRFGATDRRQPQSSSEDETDRLSRNVGTTLPLLAA